MWRQSFVLEVGQEFGVKNGVAGFDVIDGVESIDGGHGNDSKDDRNPDACLFSGEHTNVDWSRQCIKWSSGLSFISSRVSEGYKQRSRRVSH